MDERRADPGEDWEAVEALHARGGQEVFDQAVECLADPDPKQRAFGVDVLAQIGPWSAGVPGESRVLDEQPYHADVIPLLLETLAREEDLDVLVSLAHGLGHHGDPRALAALVVLREHPDVEVRHAVVGGLLGREDDRAVAALIELSSDEEEVVRDWATFGLGQTIKRDTPEIRKALLARLQDPDEQTRLEAAAGLADRA